MRQVSRASLLASGLALVGATAALAVGGAAHAAAGDVRACLTKQLGAAKVEAFVKGAGYQGADVAKFKACGLTPQQALALFHRAGKSGAESGAGPKSGGKSGAGGKSGGKSGAGGKSGTPSPGGPLTMAAALSGGKCVGTGGKLTAPLVDAAKLAYIYPYGGMIMAHITPVDHQYFYYPEFSSTPVAAGSYLMTSPATGAIVEVGKLDTDFRYVLEVSCDVYVIVIHVQKLVGPLATYNSLQRGQSAGARIAVKAGDVIADDSGGPGFDFGVYDERVKLKGLLKPATYASEVWKTHTADPALYWPKAIWALYQAKLLRTVAPRSGKIDYDVAGTASGSWFQQGTNGYRGNQAGRKIVKPTDMLGYWDGHLTLARDAVDPSAIIVSSGDYDGCACQFAVVGNAPAPEQVTPASGIVVYALAAAEHVDPVTGQSVTDPMHPPVGYRVRASGGVTGLLVVRANADGTLTVEKLPGATDPKQVTGFGANAKTYVR